MQQHNTNHAIRFIELVAIFEEIRLAFLMEQGKTLNLFLQEWIDSFPHRDLPNRSGGMCRCIIAPAGHDRRYQLPSQVLELICRFGQAYDSPNGRNPEYTTWNVKKDGEGRWVGKYRVTITWIVAYLNSIHPNQRRDDWMYFSCSHRCLGANTNELCITPDCLCWESLRANIARGYRDCMKICHCGCGERLCTANQIHKPPCK
jgi:hypothetical protein